MVHKKLFVLIFATLGLSQGFDFEQLVKIANKISTLNISYKDIVVVALSFMVIRLFLRGLFFLSKIAILLEEYFIAKIKNKIYNKKEDL